MVFCAKETVAERFFASELNVENSVAITLSLL